MKKKTDVDPSADTQEELTNQTFFAEEEPVLQQDQHSRSTGKQEPVAKPFFKKPIFWIGLVVGLLLLMALLVWAAQQQMVEVIQKASPTPSATPISKSSGDLKDRVKEVQQDLREADPSKLNIAFPPVKVGIHIDPPTK